MIRIGVATTIACALLFASVYAVRWIDGPVWLAVLVSVVWLWCMTVLWKASDE